MIYVKSLLVGLLAVPVACFSLVIVVVLGLFAYAIIHRSSEEGAIGWDPVSLVRTTPMIWRIAALVFCAGFVWEYRGLAR